MRRTKLMPVTFNVRKSLSAVTMALLLVSAKAFTVSPATTTTTGGVLPKIKIPLTATTTIIDATAPKLHHHEFWRKVRTHDEVRSHVHSCLAGIADDCGSNKNLVGQTVEVLSAEPPLVVVHGFLSKIMCEEIIEAAKNTDALKRSTTGNKQTTSTTRTSSTCWLKDAQCQAPLRLIAEKVQSISGLPPANMENLQVVRYEPGQEFSLHTDHNDSFNDLECRGRLATCLIYLEAPNEGGETWFPGVNEDDSDHDDDSGDDNNNDIVEVSISPLQGSAIFFWNTIEKPGSESYSPEMFLNTDLRVRHAGMPVLDGEKWVCNRWIHPIDFGAGVRGL